MERVSFGFSPSIVVEWYTVKREFKLAKPGPIVKDALVTDEIFFTDSGEPVLMKSSSDKITLESADMINLDIHYGTALGYDTANGFLVLMHRGGAFIWKTRQRVRANGRGN